MGAFLAKYAKWLKKITLLAVMGIPFLLYYAALSDRTGWVYLGLGAMGLFMLIAMKVD